MEIIESRKNRIITHMKRLGTDRDYRRDCGEFLCQGDKLFEEALNAGATIKTVLCEASLMSDDTGNFKTCYTSRDILEYVSPMKNAPDLLFSCEIPEQSAKLSGRLILLEDMQDPGNVGTIMRSARAFGMDAVILSGACADPYNPKTVRASMGAVFTLGIYETTRFSELSIPLYAAALHKNAVRVGEFHFPASFIIAVGNEGHGLSQELLDKADKLVQIPMEPDSESLNAAAAAAVLMWEVYKERLL